MCSNKSLCHLFVALNIFTATIFVHGHNNSTFYYTGFGGDGGPAGRLLEGEMQLERMLRDMWGGLNTSHSAPPHSRKKRASRFIHYDYSDNAVNIGMEFSVHFLSIPVKKTIDTAMGYLQVIPKTTVNLNALFIGILFAVVGVAANGLLDAKSAPWQTFRSSMSQMMMAGSDSQTMEAMVSSADAV